MKALKYIGLSIMILGSIFFFNIELEKKSEYKLQIKNNSNKLGNAEGQYYLRKMGECSYWKGLEECHKEFVFGVENVQEMELRRKLVLRIFDKSKPKMTDAEKAEKMLRDMGKIK